jgi:hypothetical protein
MIGPATRAGSVPPDTPALQVRWDSVIVLRALLMGFVVLLLAEGPRSPRRSSRLPSMDGWITSEMIGPFKGIPGRWAAGRSSNFPLALPLMLISIASRHCPSGKVRAIGMLNFPAAAACAISPNVS